MFEDMQDKVALITGATSGIGEAAAHRFANEGVKVILAGRNEKQGKKLQEQLSAPAMFVQTEITDAQSVNALIKTTVSTFGALDFAFNCAGTEGELSPIAATDEANFDHLVSTNFKGTWLLLKAQFEAMRNSGGAIVNVSTNLTKMAVGGAGIYMATKAAVEAMTRVAALEFAPAGIRVNTVAPGAVDTPMLRRIFPEDALKVLSETNPLKTIAYPEDVANAVLWLCSPQAGHIHGETIFIDGGASHHAGTVLS